MLPEEHDTFVRGLKRPYDVVVVRRKEAWDASVGWFGVNSIESSVIGKSSKQHGVRISNVVEVGEVKYLTESVPTPQVPIRSCIAKSAAKGKRRRRATPAPVVLKRRFEFQDESVVLPK